MLAVTEFTFSYVTLATLSELLCIQWERDITWGLTLHNPRQSHELWETYLSCYLLCKSEVRSVNSQSNLRILVRKSHLGKSTRSHRQSSRGTQQSCGKDLQSKRWLTFVKYKCHVTVCHRWVRCHYLLKLLYFLTGNTLSSVVKDLLSSVFSSM